MKDGWIALGGVGFCKINEKIVALLKIIIYIK
jgi:hypothetical protein